MRRFLPVLIVAAIGLTALAPTGALAAGGGGQRVSASQLVLVTRLFGLVGQYRTLAAARPGCPAARGAPALLRRATRGALKARARGLRVRAALVQRAIKGRRLALRRCATAPVPSGAVQATPAPAPSATPGTGAAGPAIVAISLANIVHGDTLDLTAALGDARLPAALVPLQLTALNDRDCRGVAAICLGLDRTLLDAELQDVMNANAVALALGNVGTLNLAGLLGQVDSLLGAGDLSALVAVERVDDHHLRLRPVGPLTQLATIPDVPTAVVGQIEVAGLITCPPAQAGGLPRACVS